MGANTDYPAFHDARLNWDDLDWLKELAEGTPIYLKGVCHIDVSTIKDIAFKHVTNGNIGCKKGQGDGTCRLYLVESRKSSA